MVTRDDNEGIETRGFGSPPHDIWTMGEDFEIPDADADAMIHFLQSRGAERVMLAQEKLSEALGAYRRAEKFVEKEEMAVAAFLPVHGPYPSLTRREMLNRVFPERLRAADESEKSTDG